MSGQGSQSSGLKNNYTFEEMVVGTCNHVTAKACLEVAKSPGEVYNPLFIHGPSGTGKTHLMQAVAHVMLKTNPQLKIKYLSAERFMNEIISGIAEDNILNVRARYNELDLWLLDDVQYLMESKSSQAEFFHIFNNLHQGSRQIILAADRAPHQLSELDKNIRSRLEWGLTVDVKIPDIKTRVEILRIKQSKMGLTLRDDMLDYVAGMLRYNVRELEGFLKKVSAYVSFSHQELNLELVQMVVREILPENQPNLVPEEVPREISQSDVKQAVVHSTPFSDVPIISKEPLKTSAPHASVPVRETVEKPPVEIPGQPPPGIHRAPAPTPTPLEVVLPNPKVESPPEQPSIIPPPPIEFEEEELPQGVKEVQAIFFFPAGCQEAVDTVYKKFQEVIKKHKLKFRLSRMGAEAYECDGKINYSSFSDMCKKYKVAVAIVIGPPPTSVIPEHDFYDLLSVTLDVQGISLQLISWAEINKDYRYLNLALDIAMVRSR